VRRAAITALAKLSSPKALDSLRIAMRDNSPQVRMQAAAGMGTRKGLRSAGTLTKALDDEDDSEVQLAIIAALGRLATTDAVSRLIKAAEPAGGIFKKKPTSIRVAAVQALGEARTPAGAERAAAPARRQGQGSEAGRVPPADAGRRQGRLTAVAGTIGATPGTGP
jgi:FOG: HEAT repeat